MFTDLVGSTESLVALGEDRYDSVRDEHEVLVAGTIAAYHGEIVKSTGDGYMAAFSARGGRGRGGGGDSATDLEAQRGFRGRPRRTDRPQRG